MNWLDHEYLVPVLIGNDKEVLRVAGRVYKRTKIRPHLFGERFSFFQRLRYECHVVAPMRDEFIFESLLSFSRELCEYYFPVLIICGERAEMLSEGHIEKLESAFLAVEGDELLHYLEEESNENR